MNNPPRAPQGRRLSPWWGLLVLPVFLALGWLAGQLSGGTSETPSAGHLPEQAAPREYSEWTSYARALEESKRTGKPILLDFNAAWCGPCRSMKKQVFEDPTYGRIVKRAVIPVSLVNREREDGRSAPDVTELERKYKVNSFPTLVVFSPQTGRSTTTRGFGGATRTLDWITDASRHVE